MAFCALPETVNHHKPTAATLPRLLNDLRGVCLAPFVVIILVQLSRRETSAKLIMVYFCVFVCFGTGFFFGTTWGALHARDCWPTVDKTLGKPWPPVRKTVNHKELYFQNKHLCLFSCHQDGLKTSERDGLPCTRVYPPPVMFLDKLMQPAIFFLLSYSTVRKYGWFQTFNWQTLCLLLTDSHSFPKCDLKMSCVRSSWYVGAAVMQIWGKNTHMFYFRP